MGMSMVFTHGDHLDTAESAREAMQVERGEKTSRPLLALPRRVVEDGEAEGRDLVRCRLLSR